MESTPNVDYPGEFLATVDVESVIDGDTVRVVLEGETVKVRILGIDTPETEGYRPAECWGEEAATYAGEFMEDKRIHLFTEESQGKYDQYDRLLAYVVTEDGVNYSVQAVGDGMARYSDREDNPLALGDVLAVAEAAAKSEKLGLWGPPCNGDKGFPE
ncbi:thermonuclease family protein [Salininema proteolyticum]|uniref:Thermonuclease family protein n=1 Tax=Salininema proteolyticum TaxID=1607685 RepID=A0ABV8TVU8_9ACTN